MLKIIKQQCVCKIFVDISPCETDNGGCEQTCTWRGSGSPTCACVSGVLNADNMNCDGGDIHQCIKIENNCELLEILILIKVTSIRTRILQIVLYFSFCIATNPCDTSNGGCEQTCTNTFGLAVCSCESGSLNAVSSSLEPVTRCFKNQNFQNFKIN